MKRNMDLVRKLLEVVEETQEMQDGVPSVEGFTESEIDYHMLLLLEAGLALGAMDEVGALGYSRLSWDGHEFLDAARDDDTWEKAKTIAVTKGGSLSFEAMKTALSELTKLGVKVAASTLMGATPPLL